MGALEPFDEWALEPLDEGVVVEPLIGGVMQTSPAEVLEGATGRLVATSSRLADGTKREHIKRVSGL